MCTESLRVKIHAHTWRNIDVLRHETIGLCEKLNSIYIISFTSDTGNVQLSWALLSSSTTSGTWRVNSSGIQICIHIDASLATFYGPRYIRIYIYIYVYIYIYIYIYICARAVEVSCTGCCGCAQDSSAELVIYLNLCVHVFLLSKILCTLTCIIWLTDCNGLS